MLALKSCCRNLIPFALKTGNPLHRLAPAENTYVHVRWAGNFFQKKQAAELWKGVTSVSNQGRKRGRAKGLMRIKNLHRGQRLGMGSARISFPGLTESANMNSERKSISTFDESVLEEYKDGLTEIRKKLDRKRGMMRTQTPLERGWAGNSPQGRHFGRPVTKYPDDDFRNFDSILLEHRMCSFMSGQFGRQTYIRMLMLTGNKNGTAGFALARFPRGKGPSCFKKVVNRAGVRLMTVPLYENRTVYHDFFTNFGKTRIFVKQKPPGHGIQAQRVIKSICEIVGIRDLEAILEGADRNYLHICKAFFLGLLRQRTHQELANEKRLHLVEFRDENDNFPMVVASPDNGKVRTREEIGPNEILDFEMISFDGHLPFYREEKPPFYEALPSWAKNLKKRKPFEHHSSVRLQMMVERGEVASHLTDKYPECKVYRLPPKPPAELN